MRNRATKTGNAIAEVLRNASAEDMGVFLEELASVMEFEVDALSYLEDVLLEAADGVETPYSGDRRGVWTMTAGLWRWPRERRMDGVVLPEFFTIAHSSCEATEGRRLVPDLVDFITPEDMRLVDVSFHSSKAACDAWVHCFLIASRDGDSPGAASCLTPDGWVSVTWKNDTKSCLMYMERTYPDIPKIRNIIDEDGSSLLLSKVG